MVMAPRQDDRIDRRDDTSPRGGSELPDGIDLVATLPGHADVGGKIAWSPGANLLATPSRDYTVPVWDVRSRQLVHTVTAHSDGVRVAAFDRLGKVLATGSDDGTIRLWEAGSWRSLGALKMNQCRALAFSPREDVLLTAGLEGAELVEVPTGEVRMALGTNRAYDVAFDSSGALLAVNYGDAVFVWDVCQKRVVSRHGSRGGLTHIAFAPQGSLLAVCTPGNTIELWDYNADTLVAVIEGHTSSIYDISFMADGRLLASKSSDGTVRLWDCAGWNQVAAVAEPCRGEWTKDIAFNPILPLLATVGSQPNSRVHYVVRLWRLDADQLLGTPRSPSVAYKSAKIVLVGESGVGKTGLGYRLATGTFKEHASTHGQQFWRLDAISNNRAGEAQCEAILWDLAGQPDYRIIHTLFLDDADLALIVFDSTREDDPLQSVDYWLSQLGGSKPRGPTGVDREVILVAARADRGAGRLGTDEILRFCAERGIRSYIVTSARTGEGITELVELMRTYVRWDLRPPTITTKTFQWIKATALGLKSLEQCLSDSPVILSPAGLRHQLAHEDPSREFTDAEMLTAVDHLVNHGYVAMLKTSRGDSRVLLAPDLLNNVAASMVLEARRNPKGLGSLAEQSVLAADYAFPELDDLSTVDRAVVLDSAIAMFLAHNVCFRETDPLSSRVYLVFPELINLRRPTVKNPEPMADGVAYTVTGAVENVYASLVVLLGFTDVFTRTSQWRNQAEYRVGDGLICGFRLEAEREGELDFVLYFGANVGEPIRMLFRSLFESFLAHRDLTVRRFEPVLCANGHQLNRAVVREQLAAHCYQAFCTSCGERITLPRADVPIQLTRDQTADLMTERRTVDQRARFEQALFRLKTYAARVGTKLNCFVSYAWGNPAHERWVAQELATDLAKAGVTVLLDRWENARIGASVPRFVDRIASADRVIVVGTGLYRTKYENDQPMGEFVLAAEGDLIGNRMIGSENRKLTVLPLLLEGSQLSSLPPLLQGRVYSDFREQEQYFASALDLMLSLYGISPHDPVSIELRKSLGLSG
jgi:small GTP-binding protein